MRHIATLKELQFKGSFGWVVNDILKIRGSQQDTFRAPNMITEGRVVRSNTRTDAALLYVKNNLTYAGFDEDGLPAVLPVYDGATRYLMQETSYRK